jgi:hypothetical protein
MFNAPPADFTSFSIEWTQVLKAFVAPGSVQGTNFALNDNYIKALVAITAPRQSAFTLRVGGNSATYMWYQPSKLKALPQLTYTVSDLEFRVLNQVAQKYNVKFILNIGMSTPTPTYAREILQAWKTHINPQYIRAIEVGNEPDHLYKRGLRSTAYSAADFFKEYDAYVAAIREVFPTTDLMGPSYAYGWRDQFQIPFIQQKAASTRYFSFHRYQLRGCSKFNTLDMLLDSPRDMNGENEYEWVEKLTDAVKAQGANKLNVWGEGGSASCGGNDGISNVFGSGLWALDILYDMAIRGVELSMFSGLPNNHCKISTILTSN